MILIKLEFPVVTIDGLLLVPIGTEITSDNIDYIIPSYTIIYDQKNFIKYCEIKNDILDNIQKEPYDKIFVLDDLDRIISIMEEIILPEPVIRSIHYFRETDYYTYRHFLMVFSLTTLLSLELITDKTECLKNIKAGSSHDIGKICIPGSILKKETPLTADEQNSLKQHTIIGYILSQFYYNQKEPYISLAARNHHERKDGSGYPFHIKIDDPVSDIIVVSDVFDALISSRPYRQTPFNTRSALDELTALALKNKVSMDVVKALVNYNRKDKTHYSQCHISMDKRGKPPEDNLYGKTV